SPHHLYAELLKSMTGIEMTHVPYKGSAPALTDVVAGHVPLLFSDPVPALPLIREGKVRVLGVSTKTRSPSAPDIPPIAEAGVPGFAAAGWGVFSVPAGTPRGVVSKLQTALTAVLAMPEVQRQIVNLGMIPSSVSSPEELERFIGAEIARWGKVVAQAGLAGTEERPPPGAVAAERKMPPPLPALVGNLIQRKPRRAWSREFKHALAREILKPERLRIIALIITATVLAAGLTTADVVAPAILDRIWQGRFPILYLLSGYVGFVLFEASVLALVSRQLKRDRDVP